MYLGILNTSDVVVLHKMQVNIQYSNSKNQLNSLMVDRNSLYSDHEVGLTEKKTDRDSE